MPRRLGRLATKTGEKCGLGEVKERDGLRVVDIARATRKSPDGISKAIARASRRRLEDHGYLDTLNELDAYVAKYRDKYYKGGKA